MNVKLNGNEYFFKKVNDFEYNNKIINNNYNNKIIK